MDHPLLQNKLDLDIVSLLAASKLPPMEKRIWLNLLPNLSPLEKDDLKKNLEQEIEYEIKTEDRVINKFVKAHEHNA